MQESEIFRTSLSLDDLEQSLEPVRTLSHTDHTIVFFLIPQRSKLLPADSPGLLKRSGVVYLRGQDDPSQLKTMIVSMIRKASVLTRAGVSVSWCRAVLSGVGVGVGVA